jgi:hypothetical protein
MPGLRNLRRAVLRLPRANRGAALVEAALVIPVMVILMAGLFEFGRAFYVYQSVEKSVRVSARYLARVPLHQLEAAVPGDPIFLRAEQIAWEEFLFAGVAASGFTFTGPVLSYKIAEDEDEDDRLDSIRVSVSAAIDLPLLSIIGVGTNLTLGATHEQPFIGQ